MATSHFVPMQWNACSSMEQRADRESSFTCGASPMHVKGFEAGPVTKSSHTDEIQ